MTGAWWSCFSSSLNSIKFGGNVISEFSQWHVSLFLFSRNDRTVFNWVSKVIAELLWFCFTTLCDWFKKNRATYSANQMQSQNQSRLGHTRFPALGAGYVFLLCVLIGSLRCLRLFWLAIEIALVLVSRNYVVLIKGVWLSYLSLLEFECRCALLN